MDGLTSGNRINVPIQRQVLLNSVPQVTLRTYFGSGANSYPTPTEIWTGVRNNAVENKTVVSRFDGYGNVVEQQLANNVTEVYFWGYNGLYPVAKIVGSTYTAVRVMVNQSILTNPATTDAAMRTELNKLRTGLPNAQVTTYTYKPFVGMTSSTDAAGRTTYYEYDNFGRVVIIRDKDNNIIKTFNYHYRGESSF
jgi:YD repeat-containing protein